MNSNNLCSVESCNKKVVCKNVCSTHYTRLWKYGDVNIKHTRALKNPEQSSINSLYSKYKDRAKRKKISFNLTKKFFMDITQKSCYYCGSSPDSEFASSYKAKTGKKRYFYNGIDRKNNKLGYNPTNSVPCCKVCNRAKGNMTVFQFKKWINSLKGNVL